MFFSDKTKREVLANIGLIDVNEILMDNYFRWFVHILLILFLIF